MTEQFAKYRRALRALRAECPCDRPVRVRLKWGPNPLDAHGKAVSGFTAESRDRRSVNITVAVRYGDRYHTPEELQDVIVHEWAHALAWCSHEHHSAEWGVAYARCWQAAVGD